MAQEQAVTALVFDARPAQAGAKEFEAAAEKVTAANRNAAAASDKVAEANARLQKAQESAAKAAERVEKAQEAATRATERYGVQSEQAARATERVARANEMAERAQERLARSQDRLTREQERAATASDRLAIGLAGQERRLAAIEAKYAPAIAAENRYAQTKEYLNSVIERGGPQMERAQRLLAALTEEEKRAAQAAQATAQARAAGTAATVRAAQAQDTAAASTKRLNGFVQQAGFQVSDAANQIATGTNAFTVLGMQGGQLLGTLGPLGAALGAVVNVAGVAAGIIAKQAEATEEAAKATDLLTTAQRAGLEITEGAVDKSRRLREERNEQAIASYRAAISERELSDALAIQAQMKARVALEDLKAERARRIANPASIMSGSGGNPEVAIAQGEKKLAEYGATASETARKLDEAQAAYDKFQSSLTKSGGFSGEEVDKLREKVDGIVGSYDDATQRTINLREKKKDLDEAVKAGIITDTKAAEILAAYTKHLDENSAAAREAAKSARDREKAEEKLEKQILAAVKAADAKAVEEYNRVMNEGKRVYESTRTPAEKYADELVNLNKLLKYGAIDQDTYTRAVQAADPAFKEAQRAAEKYAQDIQRVADDIATDWSETLYDSIILKDKQTSIVDAFRDLFKRIAIEAIKANIVLPITQQVVGSIPSLFGISSPANQNAANQNKPGIGLNNFTGGSFGLNSMSGGWLDRQLGGGITDASKFLETPLFGGTGAGTDAATLFAEGQSGAFNAGGSWVSGAGGNAVSIGQGIGSAVGIANGIFTMTKGGTGNVIGGGGQVVGSALTLMGMPEIGIPLQIISSIVPGLFGGKPSVGPTVSSGLNRSADGRSVSSGGYLTDNKGDINAAKQLGDTIAVAINAALTGGGTLTRDLGIGRTEKNGLYVSGSLPYREFGDDVAGMFRYALLESGSLQGGGANTVTAIQNSRARDFEAAAKDIALGAAIDAGITALAEFDKSLKGVENAAKKAAEANYTSAIAEKERADGLGIGAAYADLVTRQIRESFDPQTLTPLRTALSTLDGQFAALSDAVHKMGLSISDAEIAAAKAAQAEKLLKSYREEFDAAMRSAQGLGVVDQAMGIRKRWNDNWQDDLTAGRNPTDLYGEQMKALFAGLDDTSTLDRAAAALQSLDSVAAGFARARAAEVRAQIEQTAATERQTAAMREAASASDSLTAWLTGQKLGSLSSLSAPEQLAEAQRQFGAAVGGTDASAVTAAANALLTAGRSVYGTTSQYAGLESMTRSSVTEFGRRLGLPMFASGGITDGPAIAGEGRYREAVVPLPDGRTIPARITGGGDTKALEAKFDALLAEVKALRQENSRLLIASVQATVGVQEAVETASEADLKAQEKTRNARLSAGLKEAA